MKRVWLGALIAFVVVAVPAQATFPGKNGRVAYTWSRGGEAFESGPRPRLVGVVSARPDGRSRMLVARGGSEPAYSPDGRSIAFLRSHRLWVARADGHGARPVSPSGWLVGEHEWSPGGTRLAFARGFNLSVRSALYTVKPDGSGLQRLLKAPTPVRLHDGAWSPDGSAIVYEQSGASRTVVRTIRGGRIVQIADRASRPTWSRHGLIAYETRTQVCVELRDPFDTPRCVGSADGVISSPTWWPDGSRLRVLFAPRGEGTTEVWSVRPDGTVLVLVERADGSGRRTLVRGGQAEAPDWQPRPR